MGSILDKATEALAGFLEPDEEVRAATRAQLAGGGAVLAVTSRRLIVLSATTVGANPKDPVLAVDRGTITSVTTGTKRVALMRMMTLSVTTADEGGIGFEIPEIASRDARLVVEALSSAPPRDEPSRADGGNAVATDGCLAVLDDEGDCS
jgi:hypothetical protein